MLLTVILLGIFTINLKNLNTLNDILGINFKVKNI